MSISSARVTVIDCPATASSRSPSLVRSRSTVLRRPPGRVRTGSPGRMLPPTIRPEKPRKSGLGRLTHWTGIRNGVSCGRSSISTVSRYSISDGPGYQGVFSLGRVMLSPRSADIGMKITSSMPISAAKTRYSASMRSNGSRVYASMSSLLTATTIFLIPSSDTRQLCRRVCVSTPFRASIRITARSAVDAPVTMFRVYCSWPGESATMNFRRSVEKKRYATSIVIPCSRSAVSPSTSSAKSRSPPWVPNFAESAWSAAR
jgi:hypothetical protein